MQNCFTVGRSFYKLTSFHTNQFDRKIPKMEHRFPSNFLILFVTLNLYSHRGTRRWVVKTTPPPLRGNNISRRFYLFCFLQKLPNMHHTSLEPPQNNAKLTDLHGRKCTTHTSTHVEERFKHMTSALIMLTEFI